MSDQPCPSCRGAKRTTAILCPGGRLLTLDCSMCTGEGRVEMRRAIAYVEGTRLRKQRLARGLSQREAADQAGIDRVLYSKVESGTAPLEAYPLAGIALPDPS